MCTNKALFGTDTVVTTVSISNLMASTPGFRDEVISLLDRHFSGDWGDLCNEDKCLNYAALMTKDRVMSSYNVLIRNEPTDVWIITDPGWDITTVLLPEDY